jgi:hypothetical protein
MDTTTQEALAKIRKCGMSVRLATSDEKLTVAKEVKHTPLGHRRRSGKNVKDNFCKDVYVIWSLGYCLGLYTVSELIHLAKHAGTRENPRKYTKIASHRQARRESRRQERDFED